MCSVVQGAWGTEVRDVPGVGGRSPGRGSGDGPPESEAFLHI